MSMIIPISEKMLSVCLNSHKLSKAPASASGTVNMITKGSTKLSNCAANTR